MKRLLLLAAVLALSSGASAQGWDYGAESLHVEGASDGVSVRLLNLKSPPGTEPLAPGDLRLDASSAVVERLWDPSPGTPANVDRDTTAIEVSRGDISAFRGSAGQEHLISLRSNRGAPVQGINDFEMRPHGREAWPYPAVVARSSQWPPTDLRDTVAIDNLVSERTLRVQAPFTLILWKWEITYESEGNSHTVWSGERPHGLAVGGISAQGDDRQLIVITVHEGNLTLPLRQEDVEAIHLTEEGFNVDGSIAMRRSWLLEEAREANRTRTVLGPIMVSAANMQNDSLLVAIDTPPWPAAPSPEAPPPEPVGGELQGGAVATPPPRPSMPVFAGFALSVVIVTVGVREAHWAWVRRAFTRHQWSRVAEHAGHFHGGFLHAPKAQTMTMVAAIHMGQSEFALRIMDSMPRIDARVRRVLEAQAFIRLGRINEAQALVCMEQRNAVPHSQTALLDSLGEGGRAYA